MRTVEDLGQTWLPVVGYEGLYEASDQGLIRRIGKARGATRGRILKAPLDSRGYPQVNLCKNGKRLHTVVHIIIATAFYGPCPEGLECRHLDGNRANNKASNLKWGTPSENNYDRVQHGTFKNMNTDKTHCAHGHEFTPENTKLRTYREGGGRECRTCKTRRHKEQTERRRLARAAARGE